MIAVMIVMIAMIVIMIEGIGMIDMSEDHMTGNPQFLYFFLFFFFWSFFFNISFVLSKKRPYGGGGGGRYERNYPPRGGYEMDYPR